MSNPLHIYVDIAKQKGILEKKDNGIYKLLNRIGSFTVSIKEYEEELKKLPLKNGKIQESEILELKKKFTDVVWIYQLVGSNLPQHTTTNSFNEAMKIGLTFEWSPDIKDLEVGGGFVYIQPYRKNEVPEINLNNGALFFSLGSPEINGAMWYEDKDGAKSIADDTVIAFGSTVYLLIYTKDLYGQVLGIQFKDDDSMRGNDEADDTDDDLGIYAESGKRINYKINDSLPEIIRKDTKIERQVKTFELNHIPDKAILGELSISDSNKHDGRVAKKKSIQGTFFPVFIDPFWSAEANGILEGSEIEIFPTVSNRNIKNPLVLKSATLKVSAEGKKINQELEQFNRPALVGEAEANPASFHHCRYDIIKLFYNKNIDLFDSKKNLDNTINPIELVTKQTENKVIVLLGDLNTLECKHHNTVNDHSQNKFKVSSLVINPQVDGPTLSFNALPPLLKQIGFEDVFGIKPKKYTIAAETCAYQKKLQILTYPELGFELSVRIGSGDPAFVRQSKAMTNRKYLHQKDFFGKKTADKIKFKRKQDYEEEKNAKLLRFDEYELGFEYTIDGIDEPVRSFTLNGDTPIIKAFDTFMWCINSIRELCFDEDFDKAKDDANSEKPKNKYFNKYGEEV